MIAGFVYGLEVALYSSLSYYVAFKVIDLVIEGFEQTRHMWIFTENYEMINERIQTELGRSATLFIGRGLYKRAKQHVLFVVVTRLEESRVKSIVKEEDPSAFLTSNHSHDVMGGRFIKKHP